MKKKFILAAFFGILISLLPLFVRPAIANMPSVLAPCLENDFFVKPQQYRELSKLKRGEDTFFYIKIIYSNIQPTQTLIKVKASTCNVLIRDQSLASLTKFLPLDVAVNFAISRWRYDLSTPFGAAMVKSFTQSSSSVLPNGEALDPLILPREDIIALQKLGFRLPHDIKQL